MNKNLITILKAIAAIIMLQTLFYKFSAAQESVELFTKLAGENEAYMRIGTGVLELIASILLFVPKSVWFGALMTIGLMSGAVLGHLTKIGISHNNDGGLLFGSAIFILIVGLIVLFKERKNIPFIGSKFS
ncbi:DoxX family protein [Polaribacter porphyrae]|uniref:DoxX family protein n=1 Tax=Polaribacter porphyrae TaxID=1137780 RepID=A0A2S7WTD2_9FLAO|nr:DoxX family protein [Polaribacter porphyrae]PQJ80868.1 DoxX family protein [Polaribacter porphyrae]